MGGATVHLCHAVGSTLYIWQTRSQAGSQVTDTSGDLPTSRKAYCDACSQQVSGDSNISKNYRLEQQGRGRHLVRPWRPHFEGFQ